MSFHWYWNGMGEEKYEVQQFTLPHEREKNIGRSIPLNVEESLPKQPAFF